jgi:hypothetical protein
MAGYFDQRRKARAHFYFAEKRERRERRERRGRRERRESIGDQQILYQLQLDNFSVIALFFFHFGRTTFRISDRSFFSLGFQFWYRH